MKSKRILTGDRPTGPLHLGHYFGTLENRLRLQDKGYECFIIIADYQVLTDRLETGTIGKNILELTKDYLSIGLEPSKCTFFVQSKIPELAELTLIFSMLVSVARVSRNPTVKDEIRSMKIEDTFSLGMFSYPVSQAADILLFNPSLVPVGEDQLPHVELTREIARKFNALYGKVFRIPEPLLGRSPRLKGLDGQEKMSKSRNNAIFLSDKPNIVRAKILKAKTDMGREIRYDPINKPEISNLLNLFHLLTKKPIDQLENEYKGKGYEEFKQSLAEAIVSFLHPIQERKLCLSDDDAINVLKDGTNKASKEAAQMMKRVVKAMKTDYGF